MLATYVTATQTCTYMHSHKCVHAYTTDKHTRTHMHMQTHTRTHRHNIQRTMSLPQSNYICDQICQKGSYSTCTVSGHTFHHHLLATSMDQQHMCLILLKVEQSAFTQASFSTLSDIHKFSGGIQMAPSSLDE